MLLAWANGYALSIIALISDENQAQLHGVMDHQRREIQAHLSQVPTDSRGNHAEGVETHQL